MSKLPDELVQCIELKKIDLSHNSFTFMPTVIFKLPKVKSIDMSHNYVMGKSVISILICSICKTSILVLMYISFLIW